MLQTVDVLIGFSLVMLVLSIVVTMLVQFVVSTMLNLKGRVLKEGVAHLLRLLDKNGLTPEQTTQIADHLLRDALVSRKRVFGGMFRWFSELAGSKKLGSDWKFGLAHAIHREELIKLIIDFAGDGDLGKADEAAKKPVADEADAPQLAETVPGAEETVQANANREPIAVATQIVKMGGAKQLSRSEKRESELRKAENEHRAAKDDLRKALSKSLADNGLDGDLQKILVDIRGTILFLEAKQPELANNVRQTMAIAQHASSEFVAKINAWFDQTIDRTVESFTGKTRAWTTLFAAVVALFFQVDTFELLQRLSVDKQARQTLVNAAVEHPEQFAVLVAADKREKAHAEAQDALTNAADATAAASKAVVLPDPREKPAPGDVIAAMRDDHDLSALVQADLIAWPENGRAWGKHWPLSAYGFIAHLIGILVTLGLLTLGAPVWYEILKNLIQFRSLVSRKDDVERAARQSSQKPA